MIPWELLDTARAPGGEHELRLLKRGAEFSIRLGHNELMNSRLSGSEKALATLTLAKLAGRRAPSLLIGGLGMGFTLGAALQRSPGDAKIIVAELTPAVVAWARGPMAELFGTNLADPRVEIVEHDVGAIIRSARNGFDAIMLDVDNGPEAMTRAANDGLYGPLGLGEAHVALRPGGVLAVWSQGPDASFGKRLSRAGFRTEEARVRASDSGKGARHVIWLATKTSEAGRKRGGR